MHVIKQVPSNKNLGNWKENGTLRIINSVLSEAIRSNVICFVKVVGESAKNVAETRSYFLRIISTVPHSKSLIYYYGVAQVQTLRGI